ncbi:hypothetical protein QBC38DRAFT_353500 [Podospora fimiseda]|uniref:DUF676 domain-containing protein n=1 Tax=Podospora fimiseda TaxID=252190 RepID=A0AAN7H852_9PEZI|nr:hypothetical protein QBC38DRAFT_353500 [Podospora fimiseda]
MASFFTWLASFRRPYSPPRKTADSECPNSTKFFGSQIGGRTVINYSYTDMPWTLMFWDTVSFFKCLWAFPYVIFPVTPTDSAELSEMAVTWGNCFSVFMHVILAVLQLVFIFGLLPFAALLPVWTAILLIVLFLVVNHGICLILNGGTQVEHHSQPEYAEALPEHAHEQWIYINGICAGDHWLQSNLNRIAATFKRPVLGIHNKTAGLLFDVLEVLIQRNWGYATKDVRVCYRIIKEKLYNPQYTKVIFILHSQGAVEGGMLIDWLLQELPQDILAKLEVYTFGNAANHFNNPYRHVSSQGAAEKNPLAASTDSTLQETGNGNSNGTKSNGDVPSLRSLTSSTTSVHPSTISDRAIGHIEHYAFTRDFVALWGVLHFATSELASATLPRFIGRVFCRTSPRGGHQFVQHYLDGMFPLERDDQTNELARDEHGRLKGCAERNEFMESEIFVAGCGEEEIYGVVGSGRRTRRQSAGEEDGVRMKVKELSRLWGYRNGGSPEQRC